VKGGGVYEAGKRSIIIPVKSTSHQCSLANNVGPSWPWLVELRGSLDMVKRRGCISVASRRPYSTRRIFSRKRLVVPEAPDVAS